VHVNKRSGKPQHAYVWLQQKLHVK
jgi:hypothetical protein